MSYKEVYARLTVVERAAEELLMQIRVLQSDVLSELDSLDESMVD